MNKAKTRICFAYFFISDDEIGKLVSRTVNDAFRRGVNVKIYSNRGSLGYTNFRYLFDKGIKFSGNRGPVHMKIFAIDNYVISTDRNISNHYYLSRGNRVPFDSSDLIFKSAVIADTVEKYIDNPRISLDVTDHKTGYRLVIGMIRKPMHALLKNNTELRYVTCTFYPTSTQDKLLMKGCHEVLSSCGDFPSNPDILEGYQEIVAMQRGIPGITHFTKVPVHHKFILPRNYSFAWHGSYNIDVSSAVCCEEQMIYTTNKEDIKSLVNIYTDLKSSSIPTKVLSISPCVFMVTELTEIFFNVYRSLVRFVR
uniref:PLD-like domain protein n=1 Tax=Pithovirus LCDPAC01 TaxID=2506600 RepID=A0A481YMS5_9VIRU|nr:MAG: PLD-like domain protein [Pithovirus LCDPAC01]